MRLPKCYKTLFYNLYDLGIIWKSGNSRDLEYVKYDVISGDFFNVVTYVDKNNTKIDIYFSCEFEREHNMIYILLYKGDDPKEGLYFSKYIALTDEMQSAEAMHNLISYFRDYRIETGMAPTYNFTNAMAQLKK